MKETKEKIILKALQYFTEHDYEGASLYRIARAIGITKGGIYHYFKSKDELFHDCMIFLFSALKEISSNMISKDIKLKELLRGLFSFDELFNAIASMFQIDLLNDYFNYAYLMFVGIKKFPDIKTMVGGIYASMQKELTVILKALQANGEIDSSLDCNAMAFELAAMMEGSMLIAGFDSKIDMKDLGNRMAENIEKRIAAK